MTDQRQTNRPPDPDPARAPWEEWARSAGAVNGAPPSRGLPDLSALLALFESLRRVVPLELHEQLNALQREFLLTIRALIDWYLERLDGPRRPPRVEDIPID